MSTLYLAVGGMPEAVEAYRQHQSLKDVQVIQQFILDTYQDDFYKYADTIDERVLRILRKAFNFIPAHIGQKIKYSNITRDDKSHYVKSAVDLLNLARVCHLVYHASCAGLPLVALAGPEPRADGTYYFETSYVQIVASALKLQTPQFD